jgi:hypothetical protein
LHCAENPIYVFQEMKLRSLAPNSYIHISVSYLFLQVTTIYLEIPQRLTLIRKV